MWNNNGTNIFVALTELCKEQTNDLAAASQDLASGIPSGADIQALVMRLCRIREGLSRCVRLRDQLSMAKFDKEPLDTVLQTFITELENEERRRRNMLEDDAGEDLGADYIERVSLDALKALRETLSGFRNVPPTET